MTRSLALATILLLAAPVMAQGAAPPEAPQPTIVVQAPVVPEADRPVCKRMETTGTRLGARRECKTRQQWALDQMIVRQDMNILSERSAASSPSD